MTLGVDDEDDDDDVESLLRGAVFDAEPGDTADGHKLSS